MRMGREEIERKHHQHTVLCMLLLLSAMSLCCCAAPAAAKASPAFALRTHAHRPISLYAIALTSVVAVWSIVLALVEILKQAICTCSADHLHVLAIVFTGSHARGGGTAGSEEGERGLEGKWGHCIDVLCVDQYVLGLAVLSLKGG